MQFATQHDLSLAYLILRHLYDGDIIEWPIPEEHPQRAIFVALEDQGYVARWDRTWPKADRYRLTEAGIAAIEAVYKPAGAETVWNDLRCANLAPAARRQHIQNMGYEPYLWSLLHDPSTQWDSYDQDGSRYWNYLYEDERPGRRHRHHVPYVPADDVVEARQPQHLVDLDREVQAGLADANVELPTSDYDVS